MVGINVVAGLGLYYNPFHHKIKFLQLLSFAIMVGMRRMVLLILLVLTPSLKELFKKKKINRSNKGKYIIKSEKEE